LGRHGVMDKGNGLSYVRSRYYSSSNGRFITKDPLTERDGDSQSLNRYVYALNNPVRLIDISGLMAQESTGRTLTLATSDQSHLHNLLISPSTSGYASPTPILLTGFPPIGYANSTPQVLAESWVAHEIGCTLQDVAPEVLKRFGKQLIKQGGPVSASDLGYFLYGAGYLAEGYETGKTFVSIYQISGNLFESTVISLATLIPAVGGWFSPEVAE